MGRDANASPTELVSYRRTNPHCNTIRPQTNVLNRYHLWPKVDVRLHLPGLGPGGFYDPVRKANARRFAAVNPHSRAHSRPSRRQRSLLAENRITEHTRG